MEISFQLQELDGQEVTEEKLELLQASLGVQKKEDLQSKITALAEAGIFEYVEMLAGKGMPNRADEAKQDRLLYIIKKVFRPALPDEDDISVMFQLTNTQAKTLLKNTLSRYRTKLHAELHETLKEIFNLAENSGDDFDVTIMSDVFLEQLNLIIAKKGAGYNPIRKKPVGSRKYSIAADTHTALSKHFGS